MPRGYNTRDRWERQDPYTNSQPRGYPQARDDEYYQSDRSAADEVYQPSKPQINRNRAEPAPWHRDDLSPRRGTGLADDYYNPPEDREYSRHNNRDHRFNDSARIEHIGDYPLPMPRHNSSRRGRSTRRHNDYDDTGDEPYSRSKQPPKLSRRKSFINAIGLGKSDKQPEREPRMSSRRSVSRGRRDNSYSPDPPIRRHHSTRYGDGKRDQLKRSNTDWPRAAGSAMKAGAAAAFELRNDPSPWVGPKGVKVATAAIGAAVVDSFGKKKTSSRHKNSTSSRSGGGRPEHDTFGEIKSTLRNIVYGDSGQSSSRNRRRHY